MSGEQNRLFAAYGVDLKAAPAAQLRESLQQCIVDAGRAQITVAADLGISQKHLSQILTGKVNLTLDWADRIARACGYQVVALVVHPPSSHDRL